MANIEHNKSSRLTEGFSNIKSNPSYNNMKPHVVVLYTKGLSESSNNICSKHVIQMHIRTGRTIMDLLVNLKDRDTILKKSWFIYRYKCCRLDCEEEYIGESGRKFAERFKEDMKAPSSIYDQNNTTGHAYLLTTLAL